MKAHQYPMVIDEVKSVTTDFATIQGGLDWFRGRIITGACRLDADAGAYDEQVQFRGLVVAPGATLTLQGDTRALAAASWVDGSIANQAAIPNGGTFNAANRCTLATNAARDQITVAGGTVDPDFTAAGYGAGDGILVYADDGNFYERVINAILAPNNIIQITVALPGGATLGTDGRAVALKPNRSIELSAVGHCIEVVGTVANIILDGWFLKTAFAGTGSEYGVYVGGGGSITCRNTLTYCEDNGFYVEYSNGSITANDGACSAFGGVRGVAAQYTGSVTATYVTCVGNAYGIFAYGGAFVYAFYAVTARCGTQGWSIRLFSGGRASSACDRSSALAYYANDNSMLYANATDNNNTIPGVGNYSPAPPGIPGYGNGNGDAVIYASA